MAETGLTPRVARARRLRRRHTIALTTVAGLLLLTFLWATAYYRSWSPNPTAVSTPACPSVVKNAPSPASVRLNVYNATDRSGLAHTVAEQLRKRSFAVVYVSNDPEKAVVHRAADVRFGSRGTDAAYLVAQQLTGAQMMPDDRSDATVDLVLGTGFTALLPTPPKPPPLPGQIPLNVYNTTFRTGLAASLATELGARGFHVGRVTNDPLRRMILDVGEIRYGDDGAPGAKVLAQHLTGARLVHDARSGTSVDLVIGNAFTALTPIAQVPVPPAPTPTPVPKITLPRC